jgi:ABC-type uncharacterized transport system auxiliary subunit
VSRAGLASALGALALPLVFACTLGPAPVDQYYRLTVPTPEALPAPVLHGAVEVEQLQGTPLTRERPLLRSDGADAVEIVPARFQLWETSPTLAVQLELMRWIEARGLADDAVTPQLRAEHAWRIQGRLARFERVPGAVLVEVELSLIGTANGRVVVSRSYRSEEAAADDPSEAARAFGRALGTIFEHFAGDVSSSAS